MFIYLYLFICLCIYLFTYNYCNTLRNLIFLLKVYIKKQLITEEEYTILSGGGGKNDDGWIDKWAMPLHWASKMVNESFQAKGDKVVPKDAKEIVNAIQAYQIDLLKIVTHFENQLPSIQIRCVQIAVFAYITLGVISGQGTLNRLEHTDFGWGVLILNFPFIELVKYALIIGWMKVAIYLQNPFGEDVGYDIDMKEYLDVQIWKATCITTEGKPPS